jgi:hypothetical protein
MLLAPAANAQAPTDPLADAIGQPCVADGQPGTVTAATGEVTRFAARGRGNFGAATVVATLTCTATADPTVTETDTQTVRDVVVQQVTGTCQILRLVLGPLDLNLLGLRIQLNQVILLITAQQGGGLLGDLLCAIAGLLEGSGPPGQLVVLLNRVLGALG